MRFSDVLYETWMALLTNKARSLLTILGIVIGISAVIAMTSLIGGMKQSLVEQLGLDQSRVIFIDLVHPDGTSATIDDISVIQQNVDGYDFITSTQSSMNKVTSPTKQADAFIVGAGQGFFKTVSPTLIEGRMLSDSELASSGMLALIDTTMAKALYSEGESPVGSQIQIGNDTYSVVGVVEANDFFGMSGTVYLPLPTCQLRVTGMQEFDRIIGYASEGADVQDLAQRTEQFAQQRFGISNDPEGEGFGWVSASSIQSIQQELDAILMAFQLMMTAVASISLLVGGIGIMNMMLTNVSERMREIGLRKALGAHNSDIVVQFLTESIAICLIGGLIGILLGYAGAWLLAGIASAGMSEPVMGAATTITPIISIQTVLLAAGICAGIGVLFGIWPAYRAAKLDPVESLRQ